MTVYVQVCYKPEEFRWDGWTPWINSKSHDETVILAAHRFCRDSRPNDGQEFIVYSYPETLEPQLRHANGRPKQCLMTVMTAHTT